MIKAIKENFESIIVILFSILPIIDSINGILTHYDSLSIGTIYKLLVITFLLFFAWNSRFYTKKIIKLFCISVGYIIFSMLINILLSGFNLISVSFPLKLIINIVLFTLLICLVKFKVINGKTFYNIFDNSVNLMMICFLIPYFLGVGYSNYEGGIGYKGFYYSQNELNAVLIILFYFCLYKTIKRVTWKNVLQLLGMTTSILLMNTKSSMIALALGFIMFFIEYFRTRDIKVKKATGLILTVSLILSWNFIWQQIQNFLDRQSSLFNMYGNSFFDTLISGRTYFLFEAWELLISSPYLFLRLFIGNGFVSNILIEMDFLDIFFYLGVIGVGGAIIFLMCIFRESIKNFRSDKSIIRMYGFLLVLAFSAVTGHVLFMSVSGWYFVLLCCFNLTYYSEKLGGTNETSY